MKRAGDRSKVGKAAPRSPDTTTGETSTPPGWEDICARCGLCCFEKIEDERGTIFFTRKPCRYLDVVSRRCRIYERRFAINPECVKLTPELVKDLPWLHDECAYRKALGTGRGRRDLKQRSIDDRN